MNGFKSIIFAITCVFGQTLWAQASPIPMLESSANSIIATLKENKAGLKNNPTIVYQAVRRYLLPNVDVNGMARSVLGRAAWNSASSVEKKEFSEAFTQLVIRTYASPMVEYTDETVKFSPIREATDSRFLRVSSVIVRANGHNIPLNYSLVAKNGQWKIYDLSVEGVSLLQSFRSQFGQALHNKSMKELIAQLRENKKAA